MNLLYLVGAPGVGKSTTVAALTAGCHRRYVAKPLHHEWLVDVNEGVPVAVELGRWREGFPGTDTLPLNAAPIAAAFMATRPASLVLAEGDRLAHAGFLEASAAAGYQVHVAYLHADPATVDGRCAARGSKQNESWRRGRATKAGRLAEWASEQYPMAVVDTAANSPDVVAKLLRGAFPFLAALPEATA